MKILFNIAYFEINFEIKLEIKLLIYNSNGNANVLSIF